MPISPLAHVDPTARLAHDVEVGPFSVVHAEVEIGPGGRIGAYCEIGLPSPLAGRGARLTIGARAQIRSHSVIYAGSSFGDDLECGHRVTLREATRCGHGVRIGTSCDVQGDCTLGDHARMHSSVFVAKGSRIGEFAWLLPRVVLANDPTPPSDPHFGCAIEPFAVVSACALVMPGVVVGRGALVAAGACVTADVPEGMLAKGVPARIVGPASAVRLRGRDGQPAYPWRRHFHRGYPSEVVQRWLAGDDEGDGDAS